MSISADLLTAVLARATSADIIWPGFLLAGESLRWLPITIPLGLLVEWPVVRYLGGRTWRRAIWPTVAVNLASTVVGIVLVPLGTLFGWELLVGLLQLGSFTLVGWGGTLLAAAAANALVEIWVLRWGFKVPLTWRGLALMTLANVASVAVALVPLAGRPIPP